MKRLFYLAICTALIIGLFSGCSPSGLQRESQSSSTSGIKFEYFYRGFTSVNEDDDSKYPTGIYVIQSENDWYDFMNRYVPGIPYYLDIDYSRECLIVDSSYHAKPNYATSFDIKKINIKDNKINIQGDFDTGAGIYALNAQGIDHYFVNIVKVSKSDVPSDIENIYKKE